MALTWTAPVITGGTITGYLVEKSANGTTGWSTVTTTGAVLTYTVTGLTNETIQYFRVSAINAVGTGSGVQRAQRDADGGVGHHDHRHLRRDRCPHRVVATRVQRGVDPLSAASPR